MVGISGIELLGLKPVQSRVRSRRMLLGRIASVLRYGRTWLVGVVATRNIAGTFLLSFLSTYPQVFYRYFLTGL